MVFKSGFIELLIESVFFYISFQTKIRSSFRSNCQISIGFITMLMKCFAWPKRKTMGAKQWVISSSIISAKYKNSLIANFVAIMQLMYTEYRIT